MASDLLRRLFMHLVDINNTYSDVGGGVRTYQWQKFRYFASHPEHTYAVIVPGSRSQITRVDGGTMYSIKGIPVESHDSGPGYRIMFDLDAIKRAFEIELPDLVEVGAPYGDYFLAKLARRFCDPVIVGFYHFDPQSAFVVPQTESWPSFARHSVRALSAWAIRKLYGSTMSATFVASQDIQAKLTQMGVHNTIPVSFGIDGRFFSPSFADDSLRASWGADENSKVLLHVSRLTHHKGTEVLLDAARELLSDRRIHLVIAGRGGLSPRIERMARASDRFHYLGYVSDRSLLGRVFASSDVYISTCPWETFGLSVVEAFASGLPVLSADQGGAAELVIKAEAGRLFQRGNPSNLASEAKDLLDGDLAVYKKRALRFADSYGSVDDAIEQLCNHYKQLIYKRGQA